MKMKLDVEKPVEKGEPCSLERERQPEKGKEKEWLVITSDKFVTDQLDALAQLVKGIIPQCGAQTVTEDCGDGDGDCDCACDCSDSNCACDCHDDCK